MCLAIIKVDRRRYRKIAQEHWGLTNEQMKGMHVHHRIPQSEGGTNDPSNLYVCSPWFHAHVWHDHDEFTLWSQKGYEASKGVSRGKGVPKSKEHVAKIAAKNRGRVDPHRGKPCPWKASPATENCKRRASEVHTGRVKSQTEMENLKKAAQNRARVRCPHCDKIGDISLMKRYHFNNCKHKH